MAQATVAAALAKLLVPVAKDKGIDACPPPAVT